MKKFNNITLLNIAGRDDLVKLSQGMQYLVVRVLEKQEILAAFIQTGGLELVLEKLTACHQVIFMKKCVLSILIKYHLVN